MAEQENTPTEAEALAQTIEARLDDVVHENLCACRLWPASCVTYGETRPWTHSDVGAIVAMTVDALADERAKRPDREQIETIIADGVNTLTAEQLRELFIDPVAIANDVFAAFEGGRDV